MYPTVGHDSNYPKNRQKERAENQEEEGPNQEKEIRKWRIGEKGMRKTAVVEIEKSKSTRTRTRINLEIRKP